MNEELQSTNEELQVINDVLRLRSEELDATKSFLASALRSLGSAVVVLDGDLRVKVWGPGSEDLWGLHPDEAVGRPLNDLDIGLPVRDIEATLRRTLAGRPAKAETSIEGMNRRGRPVSMLVQCGQLRGEDGATQGVIVVLNDSDAQS